MQDRVADVLGQRAALDRGATPAIFLSILLHGAVAAVAVYAATQVPKNLPRTTVQIQFVSRPRVIEPAGVQAPAKAVEKPKTPRIDAPKPEPVKPVKTTAPPEKNTVPLSSFGQSTKKGSENPEPPNPAASNQPPTASNTVAIGGAGVTGLEGGDFPYTDYVDRMTTLIGSRFLRPQSATGAPAIIHFVINRDGRVRDATIETSSGNGTFDRAALRAVIEASPLVPLPFAYNGTYLGVHLTFR